MLDPVRSFEDHFSGAASHYARYRPGYPAELFEYLASLTASHDFAWDAGTGTGQCAAQLRDWFTRVVATDASREQLALAPAVNGVEYRTEPAEKTSLRGRSVDLVTVAAAAHWFDLDSFYAEVRRVARPEGIIAVWAYHLPIVSGAVNSVLHNYTYKLLGPYWPRRGWHVLNEYRSLPFPFAELKAPELYLVQRWGLDELKGFLGSWSAALAYRAATGRDAVQDIAPALERAWEDPDAVREVRCRLHMRVGRAVPGNEAG